MKETKFKDTEIGRIPEEWEIGYFGDVLCTFSAGATPYRGIPDYYNGKINWISSGELNYNVIYDTIEHISEEALRNTNLCLHAPGTFLMAITGLEATGTRGKCAFVGAPSATNQSCLAINGTNKMDIKYLYWYYRMYGDYLAFKYSQGTKQQSFTATIVKNLPITYPKQVIEQHHIASALTSIDNLISSLGKLIEKKKNIKRGTMQQLLTGKTRLKGFSEPWVEKKLGDVAVNYTGLTYSPMNVKSYGTLVLRSSNIQKGILVFNDNVFVDMDIPSRAIAKKNDLLICVRNGSKALIGKSAVITDYADGMAFGAFMTILHANDIQQGFLNYLWQADYIQQQVKDNMGATINQITNADIEQFKIVVPHSLKEQQAIATILTKMDNEITALEAKRAKYEAIKQGMMQQLLTGKIRLIG